MPGLHGWEEWRQEQEAELATRERLVREREAELVAREQRLQALEATAERRYQALVEARRAAAGWAAAAPSAPATTPEGPGAEEEAAEKTRDAVQLLEAAQEASQSEALGDARQLLETPCAKSAARALMATADVAKDCDKEALWKHKQSVALRGGHGAKPVQSP